MTSPTKAEGLFAATFTPMTKSGVLDLDQVPAMCDQLIADGVAGVFVNGSTGEGASLTGAERRAVVEAWVAAAAGRIRVFVHVGHDSVAESASLAAHAASAGADAVAACPPTYFKPASVREVAEGLQQIALAAPSLPLYYYHIPGLTGVAINVVDLFRIAGTSIPSFAGVKFSAMDVVMGQACIEYEDGRYDFFWGSDESLLTGLTIGARAAIGSTYNFAAPMYRHLMQAFDSGDLKTAVECQRFSTAFIAAIIHHHPAIAALKATMGLTGLSCGPVRTPLHDLDDHHVQRLREDLDALDFFVKARG